VKEAEGSTVIRGMYNRTRITIQSAASVDIPTHTMSTRKKSLIRLSAEVDLDVLNAIRDVPGLSRWDYATRTGLRLSTICGAVCRLTDLGKVKVSGQKTDPNTGRPVETLEPYV
jgi:hypothetical protein